MRAKAQVGIGVLGASSMAMAGDEGREEDPRRHENWSDSFLRLYASFASAFLVSHFLLLCLKSPSVTVSAIDSTESFPAFF